MRYSKRTDQWFEVVIGSGTASHIANESSVNLTITTASGNSVLRRTKRRFPYQPGKSMMVMQSFVANASTSGLTQEVGLFDDQNGVMLRVKDGDVQFVIRSYTSGSVQENVVSQAS